MAHGAHTRPHHGWYPMQWKSPAMCKLYLDLESIHYPTAAISLLLS